MHSPSRRVHHPVVRTLTLLAVCACNRLPPGAPAAVAPSPAAAAAAPKPFAVPDETMEFRASLRGVTVGVVQTAIGRPGWIGERRAIIVRSRAHSEGLVSMLGEIVWELNTTIDLDAG